MEFKKKIENNLSISEKACCQVSCSSTACDWTTTGRKIRGVGCCAVAACVLVITRFMIFLSVEYLSQLPITELVTTTIQWWWDYIGAARSEAWRTKVLSRVTWDIARSMLATAAAAGSNTVHECLRMTDSTHCANWWETYRLSACVAVPISARDGENPAQ